MAHVQTGRARDPKKGLTEPAAIRWLLTAIAHTDPDLLVDMVAGPIFYRTFVRRTAVDDRTLRTLVDAAVASHR